MDITELIKKQCPYIDEDSPSGLHDKKYASELRKAYERFEHESRPLLEIRLAVARENFRKYGATHRYTAECIVVYELLKEKQKC